MLEQKFLLALLLRRVSGALCQEPGAENNIYIFLTIAQGLISHAHFYFFYAKHLTMVNHSREPIVFRGIIPEPSLPSTQRSPLVDTCKPPFAQKSAEVHLGILDACIPFPFHFSLLEGILKTRLKLPGNWSKIAWLSIQILAGLTQSCLSHSCYQFWWLKRDSKDLGCNQMTQEFLPLPMQGNLIFPF